MNIVRHCFTKALTTFSVQGIAPSIALSLVFLFSVANVYGQNEKQISYPVNVHIERSSSSAPVVNPPEPTQEDAIRSLYESASTTERKAATKKQAAEKPEKKSTKAATEKKSASKTTANNKTVAAKPEPKAAKKNAEKKTSSPAPVVQNTFAAPQNPEPAVQTAPELFSSANALENTVPVSTVAENNNSSAASLLKPVAPAVLGLAASGPGEDEEEALAASLAQEELVIENSVGIEGAAAAVEDKVMAESAEPESESIPVQPAFVDPAADAPETAPVVTAVKNVPLPMSENREAYITKFKDYVETKVAPRLPGIAIAVISEGKVKVLQAYGVKKAGTREFIDTDTAFRLASCSKTIAGTAAGILVNDGILKWDTPVVSILPNIQFSNPRYGNQISLRDILAQSTGLPTHAGDNYIEDGLPFDSVVQKLKSVNFICPPGKCYGYQNVTFSLFDGMVRNRTGKAYEQYVQEKLFNPLGMRTASFGMAGLKARNNYALPHTASRKGWQTEVITENYYRMHPAAGANASITDMARWVLAQMGKKPDVLSPAVLSAVHDKVTKNTPTQSHYGAREGVTDTHYGIGWRVFDYRGDKNFMHHGGYVLGFQSQMVFNAELQIGMVALSNSNKMPTNIIFEFLDAYEDEKRGPRKMILPPVTPAKKRPRQKGR